MIALIAAMLWGFAEATLFFIVPDVIVGLVALREPRRSLWVGLAAVTGACCGGAALYTLVPQIGRDIEDMMAAVPAIHPVMIDQAREQLAIQGPIALLHGHWDGIPLKVFAAEWSLFRLGVVKLMLWTGAVLAFRLVTLGLVFGALGFVLRRSLQKHPEVWTAVYLALWTLFYMYYWFFYLPDRTGYPVMLFGV